MKNLRDNELFDEIGNRLRNYSEDPDENVWSKVFAATQKTYEPKWISRMLYTSAAASVVAFLLLMYPVLTSEERHQTKNFAHQEVVEKNPIDEKLPPNTNEAGKVTSENKRHSLKTRKTESPKVMLTQNYSEVSTSVKNEAEDQYLAETVVNGEPQEEIPTVNESLSERPFDSDSVKGAKIARVDSIKVKDKRPTEEKKTRTGLDFYASVTPLLSYQKVTPLQNDDITVDQFSASPVLSGDRFGLSVEVGVQGKISKRLEYYGGLSYYQQNQTLSYHYKSAEGTTVESGSDPLHFTITPGEHDGQVNYNMKNLGAQLGIQYCLKGTALKHKVGAGLSYQHGLQKVSEGDTYDNSKSAYLFYQLFYRTEFRVNESMRIFFQPNFSQAILSNEKLNEPFKLKPYRAGLGFGLIYHF